MSDKPPGQSQVLPQEASELYLSLLARNLTRYGFDENYRPLEGRNAVFRLAIRMTNRTLSVLNLELVRREFVDSYAREWGLDHPVNAETMIGLHRLANIRQCIVDVLRDDIQGDLLEAGVWRGGATIFMRGVLKAYGVTDRVVWVVDSFQGLPLASRATAVDRAMNFGPCAYAASLDDVRTNFERYGLLDEQVRFLKGWFNETLPRAPIKQLAVLRIDADMYDSTMDVLNNLYPTLSSGGFVIVDDYGGLESCRRAVDDFRKDGDIQEPIMWVDSTGIYWRRG